MGKKIAETPSVATLYLKIYAAIFAEIFSTHFWTSCPGTFFVLFFWFIAYSGLQLDLGSEKGKMSRKRLFLRPPKCFHWYIPSFPKFTIILSNVIIRRKVWIIKKLFFSIKTVYFSIKVLFLRKKSSRSINMIFLKLFRDFLLFYFSKKEAG